MELVLAIVGAGPIGYLTESRTRALRLYLLLWALVFPVQTVIVHRTGDTDPLYWVFNALILAAGLGLNRLGSRLGERRRLLAASSEGVAGD